MAVCRLRGSGHVADTALYRVALPQLENRTHGNGWLEDGMEKDLYGQGYMLSRIWGSKFM